MKSFTRKFSQAIVLTSVLLLIVTALPSSVFAAGMSVSGGGTFTAGQNFSVRVVASGSTFNSFQGTISVSGPVKVNSVSYDTSVFWQTAPAVGRTFVGTMLGRTATSFTIATLSLKGTTPGTGSVSVSGVSLINAGSAVGSSGGSTNFTISKALVVPGSVAVTSSTHPDQNTPYEATSVALAWEKASGVTGFSYLMDDAAETAPPATVTDANTTKTYDGVVVGTHYFHIKALNGDGWGPATHFKVIIKEPDAKIDETLQKPEISSIEATKDSKVDIENGNFTGLTLKGKVTAGFNLNLIVTPTDKIGTENPIVAYINGVAPTSTAVATPTPTVTPETSSDTKNSTSPTPTAIATSNASVSDSGEWTITWNKPIPAGFYKIEAQGQKDKVLTPKSDAKRFEVSLANGGSVKILTDSDLNKPLLAKGVTILGWNFESGFKALISLGSILIGILILAGAGIWWMARKRKQKYSLKPDKLK